MSNKKRHGNRKGPHTIGGGPKLPSMKQIRAIAKQLDSPELREIYRSQKILNPNLDSECNELAEELKEIFNHDKDS